MSDEEVHEGAHGSKGIKRAVYFAKYFHGTFPVPKIFQRNIFSPKNIFAEHFTAIAL